MAKIKIDERFVDVDFEAVRKKLRKGTGNNGVRAFGRVFRNYGDSVVLIPENEWKPKADAIQADGGGLERYITRVYNQKSEGSCVGNATTQACQIMYAKQFGKKEVIQLSAISCYKQIGRSAGSGAMVSDGLEALSDVGVLPLDTPENKARFGDKCMPNTGFSTPFPTDWKTLAREFRATEFEVINSIPAMVTALLNRQPVVVGREGHSICYVAIIFKGSTMYALYVNSWGEWGIAAGDFTSGFGLDTMNQIKKSAGWAFTVRSVVVPSFITSL